MCDSSAQIYVFKSGGSVVPVSHWKDLNDIDLETFAHRLDAALHKSRDVNIDATATRSAECCAGVGLLALLQ
jgi:hypothetical protein